MGLIALPLRFDESGSLRRVKNTDDAVVQLLEIMWRTPCEGGWYGVDEFGLRDYVLNAATRRGFQSEQIQAANRILRNLGIEWFRIDSVERIGSPSASEQSYKVSVVFDGAEYKTFTVRP